MTHVRIGEVENAVLLRVWTQGQTGYGVGCSF
jgi:hypothetical protein